MIFVSIWFDLGKFFFCIFYDLGFLDSFKCDFRAEGAPMTPLASIFERFLKNFDRCLDNFLLILKHFVCLFFFIVWLFVVVKTDRLADKQTDKHTDKQTGTQTD